MTTSINPVGMGEGKITAVAVYVSPSRRLHVKFSDGNWLAVKPDVTERISAASFEELSVNRILPDRLCIEFPLIDENLSLEPLLANGVTPYVSLSLLETQLIKDRLGIKWSMNRVKILENPEQYRMLVRRSKDIFSKSFRYVGMVDGHRTYEMIGKDSPTD